jgi:hypothetical protein
MTPRTAPSSAAIPLGHFALRSLIVLNWIGGAIILVLLLFSINEPFMMRAFKLTPSADAAQLILGMRMIAILGLATIPLNYQMFKRLLAIVETVREGDPFVAANAVRLQTTAWILLALQIISILIGGIARFASSPAHPLKINAGISVFGWLAVLMTFLLAQVFAEGAAMRDDLEGTV